MENWDKPKKERDNLREMNNNSSSGGVEYHDSPLKREKIEKEDDLLEFFDEGDPHFVEQRKKVVVGIREKIENLKISDYKTNPENIFINSDIFNLAQNHGLSETFDVLKNEFFYALEHDRDLEKKMNIFSVTGNYLEGNRRQNLILYKEKIVKNFENSIKMAFLTEASSELLKNNPEVRVIDYTTELKNGFTDFLEENKDVLNNFFAEKEINIDKDNKITIKRDRIIFTDFDFKKGEVSFESEKYNLASEDLDRIIESEKFSSIKELEDFISFLKHELENFSKPSMFFGKGKKEAREIIKKEIIEVKKKLEHSLEKLKREEARSGGYSYHNEFIDIFNYFKISAGLNEKKMSEDDRLKYKKIVDNFKESLFDLKSFGQDLYDAESLKYNLKQSSLAFYGKGKISFSAEINDLKSFNDFGEIIKLAFLNISFNYNNLSLAINNFVQKLDKILSTFNSDDFKNFEYFSLLKKEFRSFCSINSNDDQFVRDMVSRFF